jgi:hypothetical protein
MGKLRIGDTEPASLGAIDKLYVGSELVWPTAQPPGQFVFHAQVPFAGLQAFLQFAGPTAFFGHRITADVDFGSVVANTHPFTWGLSNAMFVRVDIESQVLNGGLFVMLANGVNYVPGAWVQINPTSNNFSLEGGAPAAVGATATTVARIRISDTPNGGNIVYDAYTNYQVQRS